MAPRCYRLGIYAVTGRSNLLRSGSGDYSFEQVIIIAPDTTLVAKTLDQAGIERSRVWLVSADTNDTWTRDYGPITVHVNNTPVLLDFGFNGWGLKFPADKDNQVTRRLKADGVLLAPMNTIGLILEGEALKVMGREPF